ncbi:ATP-dependent RNA helicase YqfR [Liquorilactobacillus sucicola DSM 21376 = JCM 15457]|uniref:DEAD-box ATP-dependent RNA helicase CshB n=1 Tax=Liquorilactobacillus sucicola DSM 21376 = JCM 15457 TaxID=1423806 RepID=A0A023CVR1_9LACO|nr:DEAD/DEAH box helicase [Liquorilactobacillus sucicola]KRN06061.1 ATP-dependent RNA helicase [Liquorilactobacillus sucicola DSM 21376 = JCM 15457]GAJ25988.1 ATP-dependent RNA helicase YqfR [Liquorilactobacillus sucicola DSM 21376 = JCM 15457]
MINSFKEFGFQPFLEKALDKIHFTEPTEVQKRLIPLIMKNQSVVGQSQTGSGKTHTFLLPILNAIKVDNESVQAVITTPSRELAYQIYEAAKQLGDQEDHPLMIHNYVGGTDKQRQIEKLHHHQPQVVIGTPGRILDLVKSNDLDIHNAHYMVVDEADMTLDLGFLKDVDAIASTLPKDLQMLVFSATIPAKLKPFLRKYMQDPVIEVIENKNIISPTIHNWLLSTKGRNRNEIIYKLLTIGQPYMALVFTNTKTRADELTDFLRAQGLKVAKIHGGIPPRQRKRVMREVQNLTYQFVVATDLAARGIDIEGVSHVINDDLPDDLEFFIHRVGRTGRNGMSGTAVTLYSPNDDEKISELEKMGIKFQPKVLKNDEIVDSYDRDRRQKRKVKKEQLDINLIGLVKKERKKRKPGYKNKIKKAIRRKEQQERKISRRQKKRD